MMAAHGSCNLPELVDLYATAANWAETEGDVDRCCFFLTQAWVYAMEAGSPDANQLRNRLVAHGRDVETSNNHGELL
ncbi:MAG: hypothetical protein HKN18_01305 [Silicimonas sp.]|nr:hypothetical protein [Silicimonas sp.]